MPFSAICTLYGQQESNYFHDSHSKPISHLSKDQRIYSDNLLPLQPPFIYERDFDQSRNSKQDWSARIALIKEVYQEQCIYSVSITPTHSNKMQTLYFEQLLHYSNRIIEEQFPFYRDILNVYSNSEIIADDSEIPVYQHAGFIEPFEGYSLQHFPPAITLNQKKQMTVKVCNIDDINESTRGLNSSRLIEKVNTACEWFLNDEEASTLGLMVIQPNNAIKPFSHFIFDK